MDTHTWNKVDPEAPWPARDSAGHVVFNDRMWIMGGWTPNRVNDVWSSDDGVNWTGATPRAPWSDRNLHRVVAFNHKMWLLGGGTDAHALADVWASDDGENWACVIERAPWEPRASASAVVFDGRMWLIGGHTNTLRDKTNTHYSDVWSSDDGKRWTCITRDAPWGRRSMHSSVVFKDRLWVMGGGLYHDVNDNRSDVWNSPDGVRWERVVAEAPWVRRRFHESVVHDDAIWVAGGVHYGACKPYNRNDVWTSRDGENWVEADRHAPWAERHAVALFSFKDRLWVAGGCGEQENRYDIVYNDIWYSDST
jgi:hypothetical protein